MSAESSSLFRVVARLALPPGHYAIFGSGPLIVRGWIEPANDLDIVCRGRAWDQAKSLGDLVHLDLWDVDVVAVNEGRVTIGRRWAIGDFDVDELIDTAEIIQGLPFVALEYVAAYKRIANRPKDRRHLAVMEEQGWVG